MPRSISFSTGIAVKEFKYSHTPQTLMKGLVKYHKAVLVLSTFNSSHLLNGVLCERYYY